MKLRKDTQYFLLNGKLTEMENFPFYLYDDYKSVYEVIKYEENFLFADEHLARLATSTHIAFPNITYNNLLNVDILNELTKANSIDMGNIRIEYFPIKDITLAFFIPHFYPPKKYYEKGVKAMLQNDERPLNEAKVYNAAIRDKSNRIIKENNIFETILVNRKGEVTEGSRSNIFLIKGDIVYTTPKELVLAGITRKKMINFLADRKIPLQIKTILASELKNYDALFFTGTSIGALPCSQIESIEFHTQLPMVKEIIKAFNLQL